MTEPKVKKPVTNTSVYAETQEQAKLLQAAMKREAGLERVIMLDVYARAVREACEGRGIPTGGGS